MTVTALAYKQARILNSRKTLKRKKNEKGYMDHKEETKT